MSSKSDFNFDITDADTLEQLPAKVLRQIIRAGMGKRAKKKMDEADEDEEEEDELDLDDEDEAEEERDKLSRMAEEQRGEAPKVEVTKDDLPPGIGDKLAKKKKSS